MFTGKPGRLAVSRWGKAGRGCLEAIVSTARAVSQFQRVIRALTDSAAILGKSLGAARKPSGRIRRPGVDHLDGSATPTGVNSLDTTISRGFPLFDVL